MSRPQSFMEDSIQWKEAAMTTSLFTLDQGEKIGLGKYYRKECSKDKMRTFLAETIASMVWLIAKKIKNKERNARLICSRNTWK